MGGKADAIAVGVGCEKLSDQMEEKQAKRIGSPKGRSVRVSGASGGSGCKAGNSREIIEANVPRAKRWGETA